MTFKSNLEALKQDASRWDGTSSALEEASRNASNLALPSGAFPSLFDLGGLGLGAEYTKLQEKVANLLHEGAGTSESIADVLLDVRRDFEKTDQGAASTAREYAGEWEMI